MKTIHLAFLFSSLFLCSFAKAQNYKLDKNSDLLQGCSFIHTDKYSFNDALTLIQGLLLTKFEGDLACSAPLTQLNAQLVELDSFLNKPVSEYEKKELAKTAQKNYLIDLEAEMMSLDPTNESQADRMASLQAIIDVVKPTLTTLGVESQLAVMSDERNKNLLLAQRWDKAFNASTAALTTLNALPESCVDKMGGWKNMIPIVMRLTSASGTMIGGAAGGIVALGFEAGAQVANLLRNTRVKGAIADSNRVQNNQILACSYSLLQTNACELKRSLTLFKDKPKMIALINQRVSQTSNKEYEAFHLQLSKLPRIYEMFKDIGTMGSALTLDLELTARYFSALRLNPAQIKDIPATTDSEEKISEFLINMKARGLDWNEFGPEGPISVINQLNQVTTLIKAAENVIKNAEALMFKKRAFNNLKGQLIKKNQYVVQDMELLHKAALVNLATASLPKQYRADLKATEIMIRKIKDFVSLEYTGDRDINDSEYYKYYEQVDSLGRTLFDEMAKGSVAQLTTQTVLMIPDVAFERFSRSYSQMETYFLNQDIVRQGDPTHAPYTDFIINRAMQTQFNDYPNLLGSREAFRVETYSAAKNSLETGFKKEIIRMIRDSMDLREEILRVSQGVTGAHLCALFAPFLKEEAPKLLRECQSKYKTLLLLPVLSEANRPTEMTINYDDPCFYNSYKQEEEGQRRLFEKLIDYGSRNSITYK